MGEYLDQCPVIVQDQIKGITKSSLIKDEEHSVEIMAKAWLEKRDTFEERIVSLNMEETDSLSKDDDRGALVMTYSGSLVSIGPIDEGERNIEYTSIDLRGNVPEIAIADDAKLGADINIDNSVEFEKGPIKSSSPVYKIAVFKEEMSMEEERDNLNKATEIIAEDFAKINKTVISDLSLDDSNKDSEVEESKVESFLDQCPVIVQNQIREITKTSGLKNEEESVEMMARAWLEKRDAFEGRIVSQNMEDTDSLSRDDERGSLVLTYSGSLISIGPLVDGQRSIEYTSIDLRGDVPKSASSDNAKLGSDINIDNKAKFEKGPIKSSSPVFKIAIFKEEMSVEEEKENLSKVTSIIVQDFAKINQTIIVE